MNVKVSVKELNSCEKLLTIEVLEAEVKAEYEQFYAAAARHAKIPGFRPGHAPKDVVARHYRNEAREEVLQNLLSKSFQEAVREKELHPITYPHVDQVDFNETHLKFNAHVELRPKVKIDKYIGLEFKRQIEPVSDAEINESLKRMQESHAKFQPVENRAAAMDDFLVCDYRLTVDGKEVEKRSNEWFQIREKDYLDGFSKQLVGAKSGDERQVNVKFPENYAKKEWIGKEGQFSLSVREIKTKQLPPLDDELAKETSAFQTLDELKKHIREDLEAHKKDDAEAKLERDIFDELMKRSKFEVPTGLVLRRAQSLMEEQANQLLQYGMKEDDVKARLEKSKDEFQKQAERQVRLSFILDEIAAQEKMKVGPEDIEAKFQHTAERLQRTVEEIKAFYNEKEDRMEVLEAQVLNEKTVQFIKDKAAIQDVVKAKQGDK